MKNDYIEQDIHLPGKPTSIWIDTSPETDFPKFGGNPNFDVVIIGGGIVGITSSFLLTKAGKKVALIEMRRVAMDVTGHTTAKLTSLHGLIYDFLARNFNTKVAKSYGIGQEIAKEFIADTVNSLKIECDFKRENAYTFATTKKGFNRVRAEYRMAKKLGMPADIDNTKVPIKNFGAVCFKNQATFHPRKYLLGLLNQSLEKGLKVFENTRALNINENDNYCEVETDSGVLKAKKVIIASHFPFFDKGKFFTKIEPKRSYVLAVKMKNTPQGLFYSNDGEFISFRNAKIDNQEYFLIGGEGHKAGQGGNEIERYKNLEMTAKKYFDFDIIEYHWSTQDNFTIDKLPYICLSPGSENVYLATGFNGWGMTNGTLGAIIISDLIMGKKNEFAKIFKPNRNFTWPTTKYFIKNNFNSLKLLVKKRIKGTHEFDLPIDLEKDMGKIIEFGGKKVAAYKDLEGKMHIVSPTCTHMGCMVNWNEAEKTWDCPCHGSRYSAEGKLIHGPAVKDLKKE